MLIPGVVRVRTRARVTSASASGFGVLRGSAPLTMRAGSDAHTRRTPL